MKILLLKRILFLVGVAVLYSQVAMAQKPRKMGLVRDDKKYLQLPRRSKNFSLMRGILPAGFSLKAYVPEVLDQGDFSTCVGWSTAYYMRTIMQAKKQGLKQIAAINATAFSPSYLFERIKRSTDSQCQIGTSISDALDYMKKGGVATLKCAPYACGNQYTNCEAEAVNYKIEGYNTLFELPSTASIDEKILSIKTALVESQNAVIIGMWIPTSFFKATETWHAAPGESIEKALGGHAMAVIGYDDTKNAFLLVNSWGKRWGTNGFVWIDYKDLIEFTPYAYEVLSPIVNAPLPSPTPVVTVIEPVTPITPTPVVVEPVVQVSLKGSIKPVLKNGDLMPVSSALERGLDVTKDTTIVDMITYFVTQEYYSGTSFKTVITNNLASYVYIIASDDNNRVTKLFPYEDGISALIPSNNEATLPSVNSSFTMDNKPGNDYFLVLYSTKELDIDKLRDDVANAKGEFKQKVYSVIGSEFVSPDAITYDSKEIAFEVKGTPKGTIVPLLVKIKHRN
jgi:Papain family cysteine protease/Domain of unknown function (DUF4384)